MPTTADYLNNLVEQKKALATEISERGVEASEDEKLNTLVPKVAEVYEAGQNKGKEDFLNVITDGGTWFKYFFYYSPLTTIPPLNTSNGTNFSEMFAYAFYITAIPQLDTSNGTKFEGMFRYSKRLITIPPLDTSKGTEFNYMFYCAEQLTTIPQLDVSNATKLTNTFNGCSALTNIPQLDTSNCTSLSNTFNGCGSLTTIAQLDVSNCTTLLNTFNGCTSLKNITFTGSINTNINFQYSPLSVESMKGVINALTDFSETSNADTYKVTFSSACWTKLEASGTAPDGSTWKDYVANLGWLT